MQQKNGFYEIASKLSETSRNMIFKTLASKNTFPDFRLYSKAISLIPFFCCIKIGKKCQLISAVCLPQPVNATVIINYYQHLREDCLKLKKNDSLYIDKLLGKIHQKKGEICWQKREDVKIPDLRSGSKKILWNQWYFTPKWAPIELMLHIGPHSITKYLRFYHKARIARM